MKVCEFPLQDQPAEKLRSFGPAKLTDSELLSILIGKCHGIHNALDLAKNLLKESTDLQTLSGKELKEIELPESKETILVAAFELARRIASKPVKPKFKISDPELVFRRYSPLYSYLKKEIFTLLILNTANHLIREVQISEGTLTASLVHPREVFKAAILESAASIILLHNHPSGEVNPSPEDRRITERLNAAGKLLDIPVLDHIIIGDNSYFSFGRED